MADDTARDDTATRPEGGFDRALALVWLVGGLACCVYARRLGVLGPAGPAAGFFVMIAGVVLAAAGAGLLLTPTRRRVAADRWPRGAALRRVAAVFAGTAVLILAIRWLGFLVAALVTMPVLLSLIERRRPAFVLAVGCGSALAAWALFGPVLGTVLPRGPWGF